MNLTIHPDKPVSGASLEAQGVVRVDVGWVEGEPAMGIVDAASRFAWHPHPINEIKSVTWLSGGEREVIVELHPGKRSYNVMRGVIRLLDKDEQEVGMSLVRSINIGEAVGRAAERGEPIPAGTRLTRRELVSYGASHVDLTPRGQDGELGTTRAIKVEHVVWCEPGEHGQVLLEGSTTALQGDVRIKVGRSEPLVQGAVSGRRKPLSQWKHKDNLGPQIPEPPVPESILDLAEKLIDEHVRFEGTPSDQGITESVPGGFAAEVRATVRNRGSDYGHPSLNHQLTADLWNAYLSRRLGVEVVMSAEDVCMLNVLQKASRLADGTKNDSWLDIAGYTENVAMLRPEQRNTRGPKP